MRLVTRALEQGRIYTVNSEVTNQLGSSQRSGNGKPHISPEFYITFYSYKCSVKIRGVQNFYTIQLYCTKVVVWMYFSAVVATDL